MSFEFTHSIYPQLRADFKRKILNLEIYHVNPVTLCRKPTPLLQQSRPIMPPPSKKRRSSTSLPPRTASTNSRPREYRKFDPLTKSIRDATIKGCVNIYLNHVKENGGTCKRGFIQSIVATANEKASGLQITHDNIQNEVRKIKKTREEECAASLTDRVIQYNFKTKLSPCGQQSVVCLCIVKQ